MTGSGRLRLFVAASMPERHLDWVEQEVARLTPRWPDARWIPRSNQHVTLKFLGATFEEQLNPVAAACRDAAQIQPAGPVSLTGMGVFPSPKRARVLWIGLDDREGVLVSLAAALDDRLAPLGFEPGRRAFSAHLTLARFRQPIRVGELPPLPASPGPFSLGDIGLWRSHLSPKGARYELLESFPLAR